MKMLHRSQDDPITLDRDVLNPVASAHPNPFPKRDEHDVLNSGRPHRFGRAKPHRFSQVQRTLSDQLICI
jgi:hypothetical protein